MLRGRYGGRFTGGDGPGRGGRLPVTRQRKKERSPSEEKEPPFPGMGIVHAEVVLNGDRSRKSPGSVAGFLDFIQFFIEGRMPTLTS